MAYRYAFPAIPPAIVGTCVFVLGIAVLFRERFSETSRIFTSLCLLMSGWLLSYTGVLLTVHPDVAMRWGRLELAFIAFLPSALLQFTTALLQLYPRWRTGVLAAYSISLMFAVTALSTNVWVEGLLRYAWGYHPQLRWTALFVIAFLATLIGLCLWLYTRDLRKFASGARREQLQLVRAAFALGSLAAIDFLAGFSIAVYPVGYLPVYAALLLLAQAIWRYRLTDITPALAADQILSAMQNALFVTDRHGVICVANPAASQLSGYAYRSLIGTSLARLLTPEVLATLQNDLDHDRPTGVSEAALKKDDGSELTVRLTASLRRDADGRPLAYIFIAEDATPARQAQARIRLYADTMQRMPIGIMVLTAENLDDARTLRIVAGNAAGLRLAGDVPLEGRLLQELLPGFYNTPYPAIFLETIRHGIAHDIGEIRYGDGVIPDGYYSLRAFPLPDYCVGVSFENITHRKKAEQALGEERARYRLLVESVKDYAIFLLDPEGHVTSWNAGAERINGYTEPEIIGKHFSCFYPAEVAALGRPARELEQAVQHGRMEDEGWRIRKDGSRFWANVLVTPLLRPDGSLQGFVKITRDVTEKRLSEEALRRSEARFRRLFNSNIIGFLQMDHQGNIRDVNDAFLAMTGWTREALANDRKTVASITPLPFHGLDEWMQRNLAQEGVSPAFEKEFLRPDGSTIPVLFGAVRVTGTDDESLCFIIDSTDRREAQNALQHAYDQMEKRVEERTAELQHEVERRREAEVALRNMSVTDPLTGLLNRRGFLAMADQHLKLAQREERRLRLYFADIDDLKPINDRHGHLEGDYAITQAGAILRNVFRASDIVARIGGDEFAILTLEDDDNQTQRQRSELDRQLEEWNRTSGRPYALGLSVGSAAMESTQSLPLDQLMGKADQALYEMKHQRKGNGSSPQDVPRRIAS